MPVLYPQYIYVVLRKSPGANRDVLQVKNNKSVDRPGKDGPYIRGLLRYGIIKKAMLDHGSSTSAC